MDLLPTFVKHIHKNKVFCVTMIISQNQVPPYASKTVPYCYQQLFFLKFHLKISSQKVGNSWVYFKFPTKSGQ